MAQAPTPTTSTATTTRPMRSPRDMTGLIIYLPAPPRVAVRHAKEAHTDSQERLPEYHVKARNTSSTSENKIHDEQIARQYGFRGALVPGVTVYAYLTHPLVDAFGAAWLERGTANVRFLAVLREVHGDLAGRLAGAGEPRAILP